MKNLIHKDFITPKERIELQHREIAYIAAKMIAEEEERLKILMHQVKEINSNIKILYRKYKGV